jgi:hypothetical protein
MMFSKHSPLARSPFASFWPLFWVLVFLHQLYFGWFMVRSSFVPYVMDGNETFSVWWHAHNLYTFSFWKSFGLTDESYGLTEASHPFFHTHQGNMPRLFGFLIYVLGARTVEAQVLVTTLIIGNLTLFFCYASIAKVTRPLIAFVFCLFLFSDYLLYAQWHVVTYRVWYGFIFFGTLFAIANASPENRIWPYVLLGALFFLTFYFELVFAGYMSIAAGLFALWLHWGAPRRIARLYAVQAVCGIAAVAMLFSQLVMVFGLDVVKADFATTFLARNASTLGMTDSVETFFRSHNIVFWNNFRDGSSLRTPLMFAASIGNYILQVWTPMFSIPVMVAFAGVVISLVERAPLQGGVADHAGAGGPNIRASLHTIETRIVGPRYTRTLSWRVPAALTRGGIWPLLAYAVVAILALRALTMPGALFGLMPVGHLRSFWTVLWSLAVGGSIVLLVVAAWLRRPFWMAVGRGVLTIAIGAMLVAKGHLLFNQGYSEIWTALFLDWKLRAVLRAATVLVFVVSAGIAACGASASFGSEGKMFLRRALAFVAIGAVSYTTIYMLSPGYVLSGYAERYAPFAIFFVAMIPAVAIYAMAAATCRYGQWQLADGPFQHGRGVLVPALVVTVVAVPVLLWASVQIYSARLFPPDHVAFLRTLQAPPLHGATFAVNNYAAPVAYYAGNWAYYDTQLGTGASVAGRPANERRQDDAAQWFADANGSAQYSHPQYYVCMKMPSFDTAIALRDPTRSKSRFPSCASEPILHGDTFDDRLVASDYPIPRFWSVVQLDPGRPRIAEVSMSVSASDDHWSVSPGVRLDPTVPVVPSSAEFELLAGPATSSCATVAPPMQAIQTGSGSSLLQLPPNFRGVFRLRGKVDSASGDSRWKLGDLWIITSGDSLSPGTASRCPVTLVDGATGLDGPALFQSGWNGSESWGTWSAAPRATLRPITIPDAASDSDFLIEATVRAFVANPGEVQRVTVRANGLIVAEWVLSAVPSQQVSARIPNSALTGRRPLALAFDISNPVSPASIGLSSDVRALGLGLMTLRIKELPK